jgi:hypothetical protein
MNKICCEKCVFFVNDLYCFEKYVHGLGSLFSLSTMSFSIKFNFPIPLIRSFHLCGMALRIKGELVDSQHVLSQPIWLNSLIKIGGNMCKNKICCENGVFFVSNLISENKMHFTYEEFMNHYYIR